MMIDHLRCIEIIMKKGKTAIISSQEKNIIKFGLLNKLMTCIAFAVHKQVTVIQGQIEINNNGIAVKIKIIDGDAGFFKLKSAGIRMSTDSPFQFVFSGIVGKISRIAFEPHIPFPTVHNTRIESIVKFSDIIAAVGFNKIEKR